MGEPGADLTCLKSTLLGGLWPRPARRMGLHLWTTRARLGGARYGGAMQDDLDELSDPSCARCLVRLEIAGSAERPLWLCPVCGLVRL